MAISLYRLRWAKHNVDLPTFFFLYIFFGVQIDYTKGNNARGAKHFSFSYAMNMRKA